jgi:hypothetical protein
VDGTDFKIYNPHIFDKKWYSFKFRSAGLRWEVAVSIYSGDIVWINGPFPCGQWPDLKIYRESLNELLKQTGERAETDLGYRGEPATVNHPECCNADSYEKQTVRSRHETVNRRFKQFNVLGRTFRHDKERHTEVFTAVAVITQLSIETGSPLFQVDYNYWN